MSKELVVASFKVLLRICLDVLSKTKKNFSQHSRSLGRNLNLKSSEHDAFLHQSTVTVGKNLSYLKFADGGQIEMEGCVPVCPQGRPSNTWSSRQYQATSGRVSLTGVHCGAALVDSWTAGGGRML